MKNFSWFVLLCVIATTSCKEDDGTVAVTGVTLNKTTMTLAVGGTETIKATVAPQDATNKDVTWSSGNTGVATVDNAGNVTAVEAGTATITVKTRDGGKTADCIVTVSTTAIPVTGVSLDKESMTLAIGGTETLTATIAPGDATNQNVTWSSSATSIATVDPGGKVTAIDAGKATITVTTADGSKTADCIVTVPDDGKRHIPDAAFRSWLVGQGYIEIVDTATGEIEITTAGLNAREFYIDDIQARSLKGLQYFPKATTLGLPNTLEEFDTGMVPDLDYLRYSGEGLTSLDLGKTPKLTQLWCNGPNITSLNLNAVPGLWLLSVAGTGITSIELKYVPKLESLYVSNTDIAVLDLTRCPDLGNFSGENSRIEEIDISNSTGLFNLNLSNTPLSKMYVWWNGGLSNLPRQFSESSFMIPPGVELIGRNVEEVDTEFAMLPSSIDPGSRVVEYTVSPKQYERLTNGSRFYSELVGITNMAYDRFEDDFDFVFYVLDKPLDFTIMGSLGFAGVNMPVSNDVKGIGQDIYSNSADWGSSGKLKSVMYFPFYDAIHRGPTLHEICHNWAAFIKPDRYNPDNSIESGGHWTVTNAGGQLGGFRYIRTVEQNSGGIPGKTLYQASFNPDKNPDGSFANGFGDVANGGNVPAYSDIELYLMGMKSARELRDAGFMLDIYSGNDYDRNTFEQGYFWSTTKTSYSIDDIIALNGARVPDAASSQKSFKVLTVVLTEQSETSHHYADIIKGVSWLSGPVGDNSYPGWGLRNFKEATGGMGSLVTDGLKNSLKPKTRSATPSTAERSNYSPDPVRIHVDPIDKSLLAPGSR